MSLVTDENGEDKGAATLPLHIESSNSSADEWGDILETFEMDLEQSKPGLAETEEEMNIEEFLEDDPKPGPSGWTKMNQ